MSSYVTFLEADWVGEGETALALMAVENWIGDLSRPMLASQRIAIDDMREHFDSESDPEGIHWYPLSEQTEQNREREGSTPVRTLHRWGGLEEAATSLPAWPVVVNEDSAELMFDMSKMPETENAPGKNVGLLHQTGTPKLPVRRFVGLSDKAQDKVNVFFDAWFEHSEQIWVRPTGHVQTRGAQGRFGPMFPLD